MNFKFKMMLASILIVLLKGNCFASDFTKEFYRADGVHKVRVNIVKKNSNDLKSAKITASEYVENKKIWSLVDFVHDCPLDINMGLIKDSFEIKRINGAFDTVLFAYTIGCVGGVEPVVIKYFAYENGVKHSLRGEERIITPDGVIDDQVKPVPDANLRNNMALYKYMSGNWRKTSTVVLE